MASSGDVSTEKYPYPREINVLDFVPKLMSEGINYSNWKNLMRDFIDRRGLIGFIDGTAAAEESNQDDYMAWGRSDNLVQEWILASLSEDIRLRLQSSKTAEEIWIKLEDLFEVINSYQLGEETKSGRRRRIHLALHKAVIKGVWDEALGIIELNPDAVTKPIAHFSQTALSLAVSSDSEPEGRNRFVETLLQKMTPQQVLDQVDEGGKTALHHAAAVANMEAAKLLVKKNPYLPKAFDESGNTALHWAAFRGHREMVLYLYELTKELILHGKDYVGASLLCRLIRGELYDIALTLLQQKPKLAMACFEWERLNPFNIIAERRSAFPSGNSLHFWEGLIYSGAPMKSEGDNANLRTKDGGRGDVENAEPIANCCISVRQRLHYLIWEASENFVPSLKHIREKKERQHHALNHALKLVQFLCNEVAKSNVSTVERIFKSALRKAARVGIPEIIEEIVLSYPSALVFNLDDVNLIKYAIMYRQARVFNLIYQIDAGWSFITAVDNSFDNGLHLAARLRCEQQINLKSSAAGAALQMQRELQWFKEVEKFTKPGDQERRNSDGMTPAEVFSNTHRDLVEEGERWMKSTAKSCTLLAALIATMVFAAALTVPGGYDPNDGHPLFSKRRAFAVFGVFDALALFSSITYGTIFLVILTSRFAEEDFLHTLPKLLIFGLITLFISILSTMIAFSAIVYLVFGHNKTLILIPVGALASIPSITFGALQFSFLKQLIQSTYGRGIFGKQGNPRLG